MNPAGAALAEGTGQHLHLLLLLRHRLLPASGDAAAAVGVGVGVEGGKGDDLQRERDSKASKVIHVRGESKVQLACMLHQHEHMQQVNARLQHAQGPTPSPS